MQTATDNRIFFGRPDTMLGISEAVGGDLGIHPNLLRAALGLTLLFQPVIVLSTYAAMGVAVFASRLIFPAPRTVAAAPAEIEAPAAVAHNDFEVRELALAA